MKWAERDEQGKSRTTVKVRSYSSLQSGRMNALANAWADKRIWGRRRQDGTDVMTSWFQNASFLF